MFDSFSRGFRMIWASIKMGWSDKRLLLPSVLTVFSQTFFFVLLILVTYVKIPHQQPGAAAPAAQAAPIKGMPTFGLLQAKHHAPAHHQVIDPSAARQQMQQMMQMMRPNGPGDPNGFDSEGGGFGAIFTGDNALLLTAIGAFAWLINRMLEGVTTALVYSHLTEGKGTGRFGAAAKAVLTSLPAIVMLGMVTWIARRLATFFRKNRPGGVFGMSLGFVFNVVEIFWTLAGHLILPAIVIEGCSFWGGLKRADRIASGNLLTMGIGEVGVEGICLLATNGVVAIGFAGVMGAVYAYMNMHIAINIGVAAVCAILWICALVVANAASIYIKTAFYTCLYVWAVEAETVEEAERTRVRPPGPLAMALST
ncbi:MAG TPA: hypothetical protein V6D22_25370 [Candidatus Obscuribacterales bacterium]